MATGKLLIKEYSDIIGSYDPSNNKTMNILTKYEKTKIIGMRMEQLARSGIPYVEFKGAFDPYAIALMELEENKLPFMICRTMPNGEKEYWRLKDMVIPRT